MSNPLPEADVTLSELAEPSAAGVIQRMKKVASLKADMHLAAELGITRANIAKWRARGSIPYREAITIAIKYGASLDYILLGLEPFLDESNPNFLVAGSPLIRGMLQYYSANGVIVKEEGGGLSLDDQVQLMANGLAMSLTRVLAVAARIRQSTNVDRTEAVRRAIAEKGKWLSAEGPQ